MQFFRIPSLLAERPAPPQAWQRFSVINGLESVPAEGSAVILEITCEADSERAADLLDRAPVSVPVWIYDPAASVGSSVAWVNH